MSADVDDLPEVGADAPPTGYLARFPVGLRQFVKFLVVGGSGTLVNLAVFSLLIFIWHRATPGPTGAFEQVASGAGFCVAVVTNFVLNRHWTFHHRGPVVPHFSRFFIVSLVGLGINLFAFTALHNWLGVESHISQLLAIFVVTPFNFVGSKWWAFR